MKKLNITFCSFPDFSGNAKALYEYMVKRYEGNMNYTWIVYNESTVKLLKKKGIKSILIGSDKFKEYISKTNVFFTTQGNLDGDKEKCKNAVYVELWHGVGPKPTGFAQKNPSKEDIKGYNNIGRIVDYFIVPSDFWKMIYGATFKVEYNRIKSIGLPILDYFNNSDGKGNLQKIINKDISKYDKIIMYMPTFKQGFNHNDITNISNNIFNFKIGYDDNLLNDFLIKNNYLLCVKKHPGEMAELNFKNKSNIINIDESLLQKNEISVNEIINAFDLMITDYSSIGTEFIFLERPVLYAVGDIDEYMKNRGVLFDNYDLWTPGPVCKNFDSLIKNIKKLLTDSTYYFEERKKYKNIWFGLTKDGGCENICNLLFDKEGNLLQSVEIHESSFNKILKENKKLNDILDENKKLIEENKNKIKLQKEMIFYLKEKERELDSIKYSRSYRIIEKINKIRRKW